MHSEGYCTWFVTLVNLQLQSWLLPLKFGGGQTQVLGTPIETSDKSMDVLCGSTGVLATPGCINPAMVGEVCSILKLACAVTEKYRYNDNFFWGVLCGQDNYK